MKKIIRSLLIVFMLLSGSISYAQPTKDTITYEEPPVENNNGATYVRKMSSREFELSLSVLAFSAIVLILEYLVILKKNIGPASIIKFMVVTLIISGTLFIITAGYGGSELSPALGLLGTIAGYLLGKSEPPPVDANVNRHAPVSASDTGTTEQTALK